MACGLTEVRFVRSGESGLGLWGGGRRGKLKTSVTGTVLIWREHLGQVYHLPVSKKTYIYIYKLYTGWARIMRPFSRVI